MKKIAVITKNFPRHFDFIVSVMETGSLCGVVMVLDDDNTFVRNNDLLNKYYQNSEHKFFGNKYNNISRIHTITIKNDEINSPKISSFINNIKADLVIIFDVNNIDDSTLSEIKSDIWKLHFGYVQRFAGFNGNIHAALENKSQSICTSLIEFKNNLYAGRIIHQTQSLFRQEDNITDAEYRSLRKMIFDMEKIISLYNNDSIKYYEAGSNTTIYNENDITTDDIKKLVDTANFLAKNLSDNEEFEFKKQI